MEEFVVDVVGHGLEDYTTFAIILGMASSKKRRPKKILYTIPERLERAIKEMHDKGVSYESIAEALYKRAEHECLADYVWTKLAQRDIS